MCLFAREVAKFSEQCSQNSHLNNMTKQVEATVAGVSPQEIQSDITEYKAFSL